MMNASHVEALRKLIAFPSVSSRSNSDVSDFVTEQLTCLGFNVERTEYTDPEGVTKVNLVARRDPAGTQTTHQAGLAYFCHTDVVPADNWTGPEGDPFHAIHRDDRIYGRGSCDMKGSLAAMLASVSRVPRDQQTSPLWIVCTADEELVFEGARHVVRHSDEYRRIVESQPVGVIGEPTRLSVVHAHKGITSFRITSRGRAAHSSTRDGVNATVAIVPMLQTLLDLSRQTENDSKYHDDRFDPPTLSWNFGVGNSSSAINVTPDHCEAWVMFRPMPGIDGEGLIEVAKRKAGELGLEFRRSRGGHPVWIEPDADCIRTMCELAESNPRTVCYGTDGGEFTELKQLLVCGPGDIAQAHTTDEWIELDQFIRGINVYEKALRHWCCEASSSL